MSAPPDTSADVGGACFRSHFRDPLQERIVLLLTLPACAERRRRLSCAQGDIVALRAAALAETWKLGGDHMDRTLDPNSLRRLLQVHRSVAIRFRYDKFQIGSAQRIRASAARPAARKCSALGMRQRSGPGPLQALVGRRGRFGRLTEYLCPLRLEFFLGDNALVEQLFQVR